VSAGSLKGEAEKPKKVAPPPKPKPPPIDHRSLRAKHAASLMFVRDPVSKLPVVDDSFASTFDRALANMINRSLFVLTEPVLRRALGPNFAPLPPQPRPTHAAYYKVDDETSAATSSSTNANNKRPMGDDTIDVEPKKKMALDLTLHEPSFQAKPDLLSNFANRINHLINAPIAALIPFPAGAIPAPRFEDDPIPKTLEAINKSVKTPTQTTYTRPKQNFPEIVKDIILASPHHKLTAAEIFEQIEAKHPFVAGCT
jgi:hypothetical protein